MAEYLKKVVEFFSSGVLKLGCVTAQAPAKLQVVDQNGKNVSIAPKQVVVTHSRTAEPSTIGSVAREIEAEIQERLAEIDSELLWESVQERERSFSIAELAAEYFREVDSASCSAIFRSVIEDRLRFKLKGLEIHPRTREQVEQQEHALQKKAEKEAYQERLRAWVESVLESDQPEPPPQEMEPVLHNVEDFLFRKKTGEIEAWLSQLAPDLSAKEAAFALLVRTGRLPRGADPLLIIAGIEEQFSAAAAERTRLLAPFPTGSDRADYSGLRPFAIDDLDTREVDDAITVEAVGEGVRVGIHIADVAYFVDPGDALHEEALRRSSSIYLPHRTVVMLPDRLSSDLASLNLGQLRPTMSLEALLSRDGEVLDWRFSLGQLAVARRLSYDEADQLLDSSNDPISSQLALLDDLTSALLDRRRKRGALTIRRPELKIKVSNGDVSVKLLDGDSPSRRIISELMILANRLAAEYAAREGVPIIYRSQDRPSEELEVPDRYDPVAMDQLFRKLKKSKFSLAPQAHAGLGLDSYTQLTSPIRRLIDLVIQQQLAAHFSGRDLPHGEQALLATLAAAQAAESDIRAVERKANRFYLLKFLEQSRRKSTQEAIVVSELRNGFLVETADLFIRGRLRASEEGHALGDRLSVRIDKINAEEDVLVFKTA